MKHKFKEAISTYLSIFLKNAVLELAVTIEQYTAEGI